VLLVLEAGAINYSPVASKRPGSIELCAEDLRLSLGQKALSSQQRRRWCKEETEATLNCVKRVYFDLPMYIDVKATRNLCRQYQAEALLQAMDLLQEQRSSRSYEAAVRAALVAGGWISELNCEQVL
jgi:hypothetical protein